MSRGNDSFLYWICEDEKSGMIFKRILVFMSFKWTGIRIAF